MEAKEILEKAWADWNVKYLCEYYFRDIITNKQAEVIKKIAFWEKLKIKKIGICAMTRWGKTFCVSRGIGLYLLSHQNKKIMFVGPLREQAAILRDYMSELVLKCNALLKIADLEVTGYERIKKEASRNRLTFSNGCEYKIFSAHGTATGLMGFGIGSGGGIVVKDEACLIEDSANAKITRMLGDNPEKALLVELFNPWDRDNKAFEHWQDPEWHKIHVGWKEALKDGRTTQEFIDSQKKELTPLEFTVLYESEFPEEAEDSIFNLAKIKKAQAQDFNFEEELEELEKKLKKPTNYTEFEVLKAKEQIKRYKRIISCDPADKGLDHTVIYWGVKKDLKYQLIGIYSEPKSDPMEIVGKMIDILKKKYIGITETEIYIDQIGIGTGPFSRLKEVVKERGLENVTVYGCHFGEKAINEEYYRNKKGENYFRLQALFNEDMIQILDKKEITNQLLAMKWKLSSSSKREVVDPEKSPDYADALVYFIWEDKKKLAFDFISPRGD